MEDGRKNGGSGGNGAADGADDRPTPAGLLLIGAALILILMIVSLAGLSISRTETAMTRLLTEKGESLIMAFESCMRTGMRGGAGLRLQVLLEEMTAGPDILFIAVAMPDGTIVAHGDPERLGEILLAGDEEFDIDRMRRMAPGTEAQGRIMDMEGRQGFVVWRLFMPGRRFATMGLPSPAIFLGLDLSPFDSARRRNRDFMLMLAGAMLLVGLACLLAIHHAQRARLSRRRQKRAEGEVRRLEEEVRRREKLAAVGTLAAGVAHEIRNPLSSIRGYATYFGQRFPEGSEDREAAAVMVRETERLNRVITDLISLSRPADVRPRAASLADSADHVLRLIRQEAEGRGIRAASAVPRDLPPAWMDPDRFGQVLLNVCLNAMDAMPDGGDLTLSARLEPADAPDAAPWLALDVRDTGVGIPPEALRHIFDPYFTTKGHGTGLGLATAHGIMENMGGSIAADSVVAAEGRPGGTCLTLRLRAAEQEGEGR